ncbi:uncharacterized protein [Henckelia pumila]|uniref:uncharacterized protein n=1 Tax=Henckelia pumila TaxID=405737 RepID=UPI003C6E4708
MDIIKDYDCEIKYHPSFENPAADALSRKIYVSALHASDVSSAVHEWCYLGFTFCHKRDQQGIRVFSVLAEPALFAHIREIHLSDLKTQKLAKLAQGDNTSGFHFQSDGLLCLFGRVVVPEDSYLHEEILSQAHRSRCIVHQGSAKKYKNLCTRFLWKVIKHGVFTSMFFDALFVNRLSRSIIDRVV